MKLSSCLTVQPLLVLVVLILVPTVTTTCWYKNISSRASFIQNLVNGRIFSSQELVKLAHTNNFYLLLFGILWVVIVVPVTIFLWRRALARDKSEKTKNSNRNKAFAYVSHDIRSLLAVIALLIEESEQNKNVHTNLKEIKECTHDILDLLNSVLDISKIEAGKMQINEEEFNLAQLLQTVVNTYYPLAMKKGVGIKLELDGTITDFPITKCDKGKLKQVLNNLLSNAVKFTTEGQIQIKARAEKPDIIDSKNQWSWLSCFVNKKGARNENNKVKLIFEVDDSGKGIPKEKEKTVFQNYFQVEGTDQGTGLGLGIVKSLVHLMRGDIEIVDKENGQKGTCFRFHILTDPVEQHNEPKQDSNLELTIRTDRFSPNPHRGIMSAQEGSSSASVVSGKQKRNEIEEQSEQRFKIEVPKDTKAFKTTEKGGPLEGKRILVAEDNKMLTILARKKLEQLGASDIDTCKNGKEALALVCDLLREQRRHDFILMDCEMPEMDGFEATKQIRIEEKKYNVHIPIIALTGHLSEEIETKRELAGMDFCITKPLKMDVLMKYLNDINNK